MKLSNIDIFDINMVYQMQFDNPPIQEKSNYQLIKFKIRNLFYSFFCKKKSGDNIKGKILFFVPSKNNQRAVQTIIENLDEKEFIIVKDDNDYPFVKAVYLSIPYVFLLIKKYLSSSNKQRTLIKKHPFAFLFTYGKYIMAERFLLDLAPSVLVMSNDHSPINRCLIKVANLLEIKTVYLQHASVSLKFPKLEFDYSFLDGLESFEKYGLTSKCNSKVVLSGSPRYDNFYNNVKDLKEKSVVGLSINQFDDINVIKDLCSRILSDTDYRIMIRPHPNMTEWKHSWFLNNNIDFSNAFITPPKEYLKCLTIQISNVSGIHLDAAILGIPTIQFKLSLSEIPDQYDYLKKNLIKKADTYSDLLLYMENPKQLLPDINLIQYFMASVKSSYEGEVGALISKYIKALYYSNNIEDELDRVYNLTTYKF